MKKILEEGNKDDDKKDVSQSFDKKIAILTEMTELCKKVFRQNPKWLIKKKANGSGIKFFFT